MHKTSAKLLTALTIVLASLAFAASCKSAPPPSGVLTGSPDLFFDSTRKTLYARYMEGDILGAMFGDQIVEGLIVQHSDSLTTTISPGTAFVGGVFVRKPAVTHSFDANKDTYIDMDSTGSYYYTFADVGAQAPPIAEGRIRVGRATTNDTAVTDEYHYWEANLYFGPDAGLSTTTGLDNIGVGAQALRGLTTGSLNSAFGTHAGMLVTSGTGNSALSYSAGRRITTGDSNTLVGAGAGQWISAGSGNTMVGRDSGGTTDGEGNTLVGRETGFSGTSTSYSTMLGYNTGFYATGNSNVFLGFQAGYYESGSHRLYVDNTARENESDARAKALIYGIFAAAPKDQYLTVNGNLAVSNSMSLARNGAAVPAAGYTTVASNNLKNSNDVERTTTATSYSKVKEVQIFSPLPGARISFELRTAGGGAIAYARIYINGIAAGSQQTDATGAYMAKSEDFTDLNTNDLLQVYAYTSHPAQEAYVRHLRIHYDYALDTTAVASSNQDP